MQPSWTIKIPQKTIMNICRIVTDWSTKDYPTGINQEASDLSTHTAYCIRHTALNCEHFRSAVSETGKSKPHIPERLLGCFLKGHKNSLKTVHAKKNVDCQHWRYQRKQKQQQVVQQQEPEGLCKEQETISQLEGCDHCPQKAGNQLRWCAGASRRQINS